MNKLGLSFFLISITSSVFAERVVDSDLSVSEQGVIEHNYWRNQLNTGQLGDQPIPDPFLEDLVYNPAMQEISEYSVNRCVFAHTSSDERRGYGENLYASSSSLSSVQDAVKAWVDEYKLYTYGMGFSSETGHYTQAMWSNSTQISCAVKFCDPLKDSNGDAIWSGNMIACHYNPPGNFIGQDPYSISGSNDTTFNVTNNNLMIHSVKVGNDFYRAKLIWDEEKFTTQAAAITSEKQDFSTFDGLNVLLPAVYVGNNKYSAEIEHVGELTFILKSVQ